MSTRCLIGIENPDGTCRAVYCHHDGYPTGVGLILASYYPKKQDVENLIALGDMSGIGTTLEICDAYCRDWGEEYKKNAPWTYRNRKEYFNDAYERDTEYCYLFCRGTWIYADSCKWGYDHDWRRADVKELSGQKIALFDAYNNERLRKLREAGYNLYALEEE